MLHWCVYHATNAINVETDVFHTCAIASPPYTSRCRRKFFGFFFRRERDDTLALNQKAAAARGMTGLRIFCHVGGSYRGWGHDPGTSHSLWSFRQGRCSRSLRALSPWSASTHPHPGCGLWLTHEITRISFLWCTTISRPTYVNACLPPAPPSLGFRLPYPTSHTLICNAFVTSTWQGLC